jgi:hypothetical protein
MRSRLARDLVAETRAGILSEAAINASQKDESAGTSPGFCAAAAPVEDRPSPALSLLVLYHSSG